MLVLRVTAVLSDSCVAVKQVLECLNLLLAQCLYLFEPLPGDQKCVVIPVLLVDLEIVEGGGQQAHIFGANYPGIELVVEGNLGILPISFLRLDQLNLLAIPEGIVDSYISLCATFEDYLGRALF